MTGVGGVVIGGFLWVVGGVCQGQQQRRPRRWREGGVSRPTARIQPQTGRIPRCGTVIDTVFIMLIGLVVINMLYMDCVVVWYLCTG